MANISAPIPSPTQNPSNPFPAWRLPNGTINATETELERASASSERWTWGCGALVVVGVLAELVLAIRHPSYDSFWAIWGSALADLLIGLGVAGEILFSKRDSKCQGELKRRTDERLAQVEFDNGFLQESAAKAMERAANAERETERLRAQFGWRILSGEGMNKLVVELAKSPGRVQISYASGDVESCTYAMQFARAFMLANWKAGLHSGVVQMVVFGIRVPMTYGSNAWWSEVLRNAFATAGIIFESAPAPHFGMTIGSTVTDGALLYIGPKVMPWAVPETEMRSSAAKDAGQK